MIAEIKLGDFLGGAFEEFVDERLIGFGLFCGETPKLREQSGRDTDGDELFGFTCFGPADTAGATKFGVGGCGDVGVIDLMIRHRLGVPCGSPGAR